MVTVKEFLDDGEDVFGRYPDVTCFHFYLILNSELLIMNACHPEANFQFKRNNVPRGKVANGVPL